MKTAFAIIALGVVGAIQSDYSGKDYSDFHGMHLKDANSIISLGENSDIKVFREGEERLVMDANVEITGALNVAAITVDGEPVGPGSELEAEVQTLRQMVEDLQATVDALTAGDDLSVKRYEDAIVNALNPWKAAPWSAGVGSTGRAWAFPGGSTNYHAIVAGFSFPDEFTANIWVKPGRTSTGYWFSYATSSSDNCLLLAESGFPSAGEWGLVTIIYGSGSTNVYWNGELRNELLNSAFCGDKGGHLVLGQEQDSVGGGFDAGQAAVMDVESVVIYDEAWAAADIDANYGCLDPTVPSAYAAWVAPEAHDQTGHGHDITDLVYYGTVPGVAPNTSPCGRVVGGMAWEFPGASTAHHLLMSTFSFPDHFTANIWVKPGRTSTGYWFSYASSSSDNCLLLQESGFEEAGKWGLVTVVYDGSTNVYWNGELRNELKHTDYCGEKGGSLVIGQEQDTVGGGFDTSQAAVMDVDSIVIYDGAWAPSDIDVNYGCVDYTDAAVHAAWSAPYGKDLSGNGNDGHLTYSALVPGVKFGITC